MATQFARGRIPKDVLSAVRTGRMAFQKPNGGVRGIVVGDVFRGPNNREAVCQAGGSRDTHLFQCALSTRTGTECVAHIVQALTRRDERATLLSVCDSIARGAMLRGLVDMPDGEELIPFVRLFYQSPSQYWWRVGGTR